MLVKESIEVLNRRLHIVLRMQESKANLPSPMAAHKSDDSTSAVCLNLGLVLSSLLRLS